ncbi:hybrid sensor histidine kinase/response regulator (plasmid) [Sphingobium sp. SCG-1]|uniref:hybrid sensor histidine kinase/response regulator n=1 Tax=Sphingobium sp. SCG-1 TaxID=2072936 RepID=UPI000CD6B21E|nr:NahK/ErcS family hybrid sensor histidine kinase/response regulator [Sphingobium sp. SCG-1]AUW60624.1 hybrid sensor histidine kinase/response regulator [Sphingobium sp. SCG-1]
MTKTFESLGRHANGSAEYELQKLRRINTALINRVERATDLQGNAFSLFETAITLESRVRDRTVELERTLSELAAASASSLQARSIAEDAQRRLRDAIDTINEGFALFDQNDRLVLCNQTYLGLWPRIADRIHAGMAFSEIAQMIVTDGTTLGAMVAPDRWVSERSRQHAVAAGGHVHALADGRWIQINERRTSDGGIVCLYTDITEAKAEDARQRAQELAEKSTLLQATLDNIPQGVCVFGPTGELVAWNGSLRALLDLPADVADAIATHGRFLSLWNVRRADIGENDCVEWLGSEEKERIVQRSLSDGRSLEIRRARMPDGGLMITFSDISESRRAATVLLEANDSLERRVAERTSEMAAVNSKLQREIAERLGVEAALREAKGLAEQANLSKTRFLAAASHDLLQPLNAARLFVSALEDRRMALASRALINQTSSALESVEYLLEALMEISKLDAGAVVPELREFPIGDLLRNMKAEFLPLARAGGLELRISDCGTWVRSDARLLRRVLQNFISNAIKYTKTGTVSVEWTIRGDVVRLSVTDTGPGIPAEHHVEVFQEFFRLDGGAPNRGMGLGLAIVQRASRMLDHPVHLESKQGVGSTFSIDVPTTTAQATSIAIPALAKRRDLSALRILVIDNDISILSAMTALLSGWGCEVLTARAADEAVSYLRSHDAILPHLILADYHLDCDALGDDAVRLFRSEANAQIAAIIITADRSPDLRQHLMRNGFHVLTKPLKPAQLRAMLSRTVEDLHLP